ncbi:sensor histidine kinase [Euzebya tangerina]|uniref:sensor histidine kinase n=1 Tax=Euzebya tangerina TaxID=591198 RepID=UPI0013C35E93|nr:HAMP domain-containing sensor histidine kinase [Euzebya tangerina]
MTSASPLKRVAATRSARLKILGWFVLLILLAGAASLFLQRQLLLAQLEEEVESALVQETEELRSLVGGTNPTTGEPFDGDVEAIFETFLQRNVPDDGESLLTFVDGEPFRAARGPGRLLEQQELVSRWTTLLEPQRGSATTPAGDVRYLAVPLFDGATPRGTFVVAFLLDGERAEIQQATQVGALVFSTVMLLAIGLAWVIAGRVLDPIRTMTDTARAINDTDLSRRITVPSTDDEVAYLARTFNEMLARLESAFTGQREFLNDVGHELRTPITIIRGHLELLSDDPAEREATTAIIFDELDRMNRLVGDLVLMAKAEAPDFLRLEAVDVDLLIAELMEKTKGFPDHTFAVAEAAFGVIEADPQRLTQAVMNLIENAVRHSEPGDTIELGARFEQDQFVLFVRDQGPGIPQEEQARIFNRLAQRGTAHDGSAGLGLAIVSAVATAHGGTVSVESSPGQGATFILTLPTSAEELAPCPAY